MFLRAEIQNLQRKEQNMNLISKNELKTMIIKNYYDGLPIFDQKLNNTNNWLDFMLK